VDLLVVIMMSKKEKIRLFAIGSVSLFGNNDRNTLPKHDSLKINNKLSLQDEYWNLTGDSIRRQITKHKNEDE